MKLISFISLLFISQLTIAGSEKEWDGPEYILSAEHYNELFEHKPNFEGSVKGTLENAYKNTLKNIRSCKRLHVFITGNIYYESGEAEAYVHISNDIGTRVIMAFNFVSKPNGEIFIHAWGGRSIIANHAYMFAEKADLLASNEGTVDCKSFEPKPTESNAPKL